MDKNSDNQNDQVMEEGESSDETQPEYRDISDDELKQILEDHKKWLESGGKEGKQAILSGLQLEETDLSESDLSEASLGEANLKNANLQFAKLQNAQIPKADLREANLTLAILKNANLNKTNLEGADLTYADISGASFVYSKLNRVEFINTEGIKEASFAHANLENAIGFLGNEFAQADVTGTKLPDGIKEFRALDIVEKTSQNARKIFFAMLLGCVYSWLTIATTTDVRLLTNTSSSPLPIIGTEIPIAWFYITAPLVLICLYFYFHLYLDNLWGALAGLPAIFPDGKRLDERAYPWLLNTLVRKNFKRLKDRGLIFRMKEWITIFLSWWVVPITMLAFWLRYLPRHDWIGTFLHIGLIVSSFAFGIIFYRLCAFTLQGKEKLFISFKKFYSDKGFYYSILKYFLFSISTFLIGIFFLLMSYGAINGIRTEKNYNPDFTKFSAIEKAVPWGFAKIGYDVFANLREIEVSEKPDNYWIISEKERLQSVKGANLRERNLSYADMYGAFLLRADMRNTDLRYANLENADLRADLRYANLSNANLKEANLNYARLQEANLEKTDLQNANLLGAELQGTKSLTIERLSKVKTLYQAKLDPELLEQVKKCCSHLLEEPKKKPDQTE